MGDGRIHVIAATNVDGKAHEFNRDDHGQSEIELRDR